MQEQGVVVETQTVQLQVPPRNTPHARYGYVWLAALLVGPLILLALLVDPSLDQVTYHNPLGHLLIGGAAAILGALLALLALRIAWRAQDGRVFLVGMGFLSVASIFFVHAISTPSVIFAERGFATAISAPISLCIGAVFFALSGLHIAPAADRWIARHAGTLVCLYLICWLVYGWGLLFAPPPSTQAQTSAPTASQATHTTHRAGGYGGYGEYSAAEAEASSVQPQATPAPAPRGAALPPVVALAGMALYAFALVRHAQFYRRASSVAGLTIACGIALFGEALLTQFFWQTYAVSFWLAHVQEFAGFAVISYGVLIAYRRGLSEEGLLESLFLARTRARIRSRYGRVLDTLVDTLADGSEPNPTLRAALSMQFALSDAQIHALEHAAQSVARERQQRQELQRLNAELQELEQARDQFTQMVVHDLKNPLTALIGFLEIVRLGQLNDEQNQALEGALRSSKNLNGLIGDLLDVGRMERGRIELERNIIVPIDLLVSATAELRPWLQQEEKTVTIDAAPELTLIYGDLRLLQRVFLNLLSNAIKHTPLGTTITLRAYATNKPDMMMQTAQENPTANGQYVVFEVEDNGSGIPAHALEHIFEAYVHTPGERPGRQASTGIGLTFCRLAVEAHGGCIGVTSTPNVRTTFRVYLPALPPE